MKSIKNLITGIADIIVENLDSGRIIVTGKNGPYNNLETNIRAYSHMLVLLSKAELIDNQKKICQVNSRNYRQNILFIKKREIQLLF